MNPLKIMLLMIFAPIQGLYYIKRDRKEMSYITPIILLFLTLVVRIAYIFIVHYPLGESTPERTNFVQELITTVFLVVSWVIASYLVTTIRDGETTFKENMIASGYCLTPFIVFTLPLAFISKLMSASEAQTFNALTNLVIVWVIVLLLVFLGVSNSYTLGQTIVITLISIFTCIFLWAVLALMYILSDKLFSFISDLITEYNMLIFGL